MFFSHLLKKSTDLAPHQWLVHERIGVAKKLLYETQQPMSEIALACGFAGQSHFTRTYKRLIGESPGAVRRAMTSENDEQRGGLGSCSHGDA
jgi:AraC family transcriptional regulator